MTLGVYPEAIWRESPKHGYGADDTHLNQGACVHSMEGGLAAAFGELDNPLRQASWWFSVAKDGQVYQHVDTSNIAWTNGSYEANRRFWGIEHEGRAGEPLTEEQYVASRDLIRWLLESHGLQAVRGETLFEHREMVRWGSAPTACPSGRIPWERILADLQEADMTPDESQRLERIETRLEEMIKWMLGDLDPATPQFENVTHQTWDRIAAVEAKVDALAAQVADGSGTHLHP